MGDGAGVSASGGIPGPWRALPATDELRRRFMDHDVDEASWEPISVPGHWCSHPAFGDVDGALLYRTRFDTADVAAPAHGHPVTRSWLVAEGIFSTSDIWLDEGYLGDTEGYFFAHEFEITRQLAARSDHVLALEVTCSRQREPGAKRHLTGAFQSGDLADNNPGGIWRPVHVEHTGPVRIRHWRVVCRRADTNDAELFVRAVLDSMAATEAEVVTTVVPRSDRSGGVESVRRQRLAAGENRVEWRVSVPEPHLWWPRALGEQPRYDVTVDVRVPIAAEADDPGVRGPLLSSDRRTRTLGLRRVDAERWTVRVNGERMFLKGAVYQPTRPLPAEATLDDLRRDVALAEQAGLDLLRLQAHIARPEFYDLADTRGLLLWQDLPLQGGYHRSVRREARRQAREAVDLLAHHPSVIVWCGHDDPAGSGRSPLAASVARAVTAAMTPTWNRAVLDHGVTRVLQRSDGSRPVVAHSGGLPQPPTFDGTDTHVFVDSPQDLPGVEALLRRWPRLCRFVSEVGLTARTPAMGVCPPGRHDPSHDAQAEVVRRVVEGLRCIKYRPCGGVAVSTLVDSTQGGGYGVVDHERRPKPAFAALADASRTTMAVATWPPPALEPGDTLVLDIHVLNDAPIGYVDMVVHVHLSWGSAHGPETHTWSWTGTVDADDVAYVGTLRALVPDAPGPVTIDLELAGPGLPGAVPIRTSYRTRITAPGGDGHTRRSVGL